MRRVPVLALAGSLVVSLAAFGASQPPQAPLRVSASKQPLVRKSAETITAAQLRDYLTYVASDEMEGRATPSRGLDSTAKFIATLLSRWGVKPAGDEGTFFQRIVLKRDRLVPESTTLALGGQSFVYGRDFLADKAPGSVSGSLIFAGDGWFVKSKDKDPYRDIDPKGKIVIVTTGNDPPPPGVTVVDLPASGRGVDWIPPADYAKARGAIGVIQILPLLTLADSEAMELMQRRLESGDFYPERLAQPSRPPLPTVYATVRLVRAIFAREKTPGEAILMSFPNGTPDQAVRAPARQTDHADRYDGNRNGEFAERRRGR